MRELTYVDERRVEWRERPDPEPPSRFDELPLFEMYLSSVNLRIARDNARANIEPALDLAQGGRVDPRAVVSEVFDWESLPEELPRLYTKPVFVRDPVVKGEVARAEAATVR